jgi:hypothetical protein
LGYVDFDQRKGHMTILYEIAKKNNMNLEEYKVVIDRFDDIAKILIEHFSADPNNRLDKKDIKWLFNMTIYGGGIDSWIEKIQEGDVEHGIPPKKMKNITSDFGKYHPIYQNFKNKTGLLINTIYESNKHLLEFLDIPEYACEHQKKNKIMSLFCQTIENEINYQAYQFLVKSGYVKKQYCVWGYDGLTFIPEKPLPEDISDQITKYIREGTYIYS